MEQLQTVLDWMKANPWVTTAIVVYVIANLAPRPDPKDMTGWQKAFWQIVDRLCVLTAGKLPGSLKFLLLDSPEHLAKAAEPKAKDKSEKAKDKDEDPEVDEDDDLEDTKDDTSPSEEAEPDGDEEEGAPK